MNKVTLLGFTFTNEQIAGFPAAYTHQALISEELNADELSLVVRSNGDFPFNDYDYASPIDLYHDNTKLARYYITSISPVLMEQDGTIQYAIKALSFVGLTINMQHRGGVYTSKKIGEIIAEIMGATADEERSTDMLFYFNLPNNLYYTIDALVYNYRVTGRLPATDGQNITARDNLRDVLFAAGASILKNADGSLYFTFNTPEEAIAINDENIYTGQPYNDDELVTKVVVVAHEYFHPVSVVGLESKILYDTAGDTVDHVTVLFDEPIFQFDETTLTINESGDNYAIVSGIGVLRGYEYTHTRQEFSKVIADGAENIKTTSNSLVSVLNYLPVLERLENYYKNARELSSSFVLSPEIRTGSLIRFTDVLNREKNGFIKDMDITYSGIDKGAANVVVDWVPSDIGESFTKCYVLTGTGTWSKADAEEELGREITAARMVLIGGGNGGKRGEDGKQATGEGSSARGGEGGKAGAGGEAGRVIGVTFEDGVPDEISYSCGEGGIQETEGTNTTSTDGTETWSTEGGARPTGGVMNLITGDVYATPGQNGFNGAQGGDLQHVDGYSIEADGQTWDGGAPVYSTSTTRATPELRGTAWYNVRNVRVTTGGATGGGAAYGSNGGNGTSGGGLQTMYYGNLSGASNVLVGVGYVYGDNSGRGADAQPCGEETTIPGAGGRGGNGGGGSGGIGLAEGAGGYRWTGSTYAAISGYLRKATISRGGYGCYGDKGGDGAVLIYV